MSFETSLFAVAGLIAALGPVIIHLLNRRRFRVVSWAAMDFLLEAMERRRRILHLRDVMLLSLRMLALAALGLALAKPFYQGSGWSALVQSLVGMGLLLGAIAAATGAVFGTTPAQRTTRGLAAGIAACGLAGFLIFSGWTGAATSASAVNSGEPIHAILVVDNSRSMGTAGATGSTLQSARLKAEKVIEQLPVESRITVAPLCGSETPISRDPYRNRQDARRALDSIPQTDLAGSARQAFELAEAACRTANDLPGKRVVILTDLQANGWRDAAPPASLVKQADVQIADVSRGGRRNLWLEGLELEDGLADVESPARILVKLRAGETTGDETVRVALIVERQEVGSQTVDVQPGQTREVEFAHQFAGPADPDEPRFVSLEVVLQPEDPSADELPADNRVSLVAPLVAGLPVVFVDEWGEDERVERNQIGETYALRHLLAPRTADDDHRQALIRREHLRIDDVTADRLQSARLVILAGVERPGAAVEPLRDYVRQGGRLMVFAGGSFDPVGWTEDGWLNGGGLLPAPLDSTPVGQLPEDARGDLRPLQLDFAGMQHDYFLIDGEPLDELRTLYEGALFFKAVRPMVDAAVLESLKEADASRLREQRVVLERLGAAGPSTPNDEAAIRRIEPAWWKWRSPFRIHDLSQSPEALAEREQPRVLAAFSDQTPWIVERKLGLGQVLFVGSGVTSNWNLLRSHPSLVMFYRIAASLIQETLPKRNGPAGDRFVVPMTVVDDRRMTLIRPDGSREPLAWEALASDVSGVTLRRPLQAGLYSIASHSAGATAAESIEQTLAIQGDSFESDLAATPIDELQRQLGASVRVVPSDEPILMEGGARRGRSLWKYCLLALLGCLLGEMALVARQPDPASPSTAAARTPQGMVAPLGSIASSGSSTSAVLPTSVLTGGRPS